MQQQLHGLKPTGRQALIFLLYLVLAGFSFVKFSELERETGMFRAMPVLVMYFPWLLGLLLIALDRSGPIRNWAGPFVISLFYPALVLWNIVDAARAWIRLGILPNWQVAIPFNAILLACFIAFLVRVYPRHCPKCEKRSLIPLLRLIKQERRSAKTWWCTMCGSKLWKDSQGQWQKERRKTWHDVAETAPEAASALGQGVSAAGSAS